MPDLSEYPVFDGVEFTPEVKELMTLFAEAWEQCKDTKCGECHYRHGRELYSLMACLCERYAEKMLENGYKRVEIDQFKPLTLDELRYIPCEPVYIVAGDVSWWDIVSFAGMEYLYLKVEGSLPFRDYGKNWTAYRQMPEEGTV